MTQDRAEFGRRAEALVAAHLESLGFAIVARNVRVGRLELDLIARKGSLLVVCEVRSRRHDRWLSPIETIGARKVQRVRQATAQWLRDAQLGDLDVRFDAAAVIFDREPGRIQYYEGAF